MIILSALKKVAITKLQRWLTVNGVGAYDPRTAAESMPYGVDSSPIKDMVAVYGFTGSDDDQVVLGYINREALATQGELRIFSTNAAGAFQCNIWLQDNGDILIGDSKIPATYINNFVKWTELNIALQAQNAQIVANLAAIALGLNAIVPSSYTPLPVVVNINPAKTTKIKTT